MDMQQLLALGIVLMAAVYLGRNFVVSARDFFKNKSGCGGGCGKCAFAAKDNSGKKPSASAPQTNIIALSDIRALPHKHKN